MGLLTIIDTNDNVLGYKSQDELVDSDVVRMVGLWIVNSKNQTLLAQRSFHHPTDPGVWGPALTDYVMKDEDYEQAIYRIAKLSLGIEARGFIKGDKQYTSLGRPNFCQWFICTLEKNAREFHVDPTELAQYAWFDLDSLFKDIDENTDKYVRSARTWRNLFTKSQ